ncbi:dGTPase [Rubritalea squalenifaciens DSM 18772]|uniref:dGTPase n=1 Tax=Rubritalea squalenifaciens DSM 18772 TaxID=1123071 RepID=A0A1M6NMI1_9BACT|nr:dNTP triphosphohydrolase [Rubritalea squalenifaciens]SHJ96908.1 dGTPase [Rubritalea squalenifaciens DSM 18772]
MKNRFYNAFDTERMFEEKTSDDYRSAFQIDRDRILHTPAFRKLQSKTQVFWSGEYDFYRTRLTHSLEVAQIGRSICHYLNVTSDLLGEDYFIDGDLVEASCLSHDLGHPPFGHAGEKSLNALMAGHGGFEGNAQTLRLLTERIFSVSKRGMNPTRAFLDGVLKYKSLWSEMKAANGGKNPKNHFVYDEQTKYLDWVFDGRDFPLELSPGKPREAFKSIECQIMDWADDVAYSLNDLADSVRAGFLTIESIERWASLNDISSDEGSALGDLLRAIRKGKVEPMVGSRIGKYLKGVKLEEDINFMSAETNRYHYKLIIDDEVKRESGLFKKLAFEVVFRSAELNQLEYKGNHMLVRLWDALEEEYLAGAGAGYKLLPDDVEAEIRSTEDESSKRRLLCDYLASLTDSAAGRLYQRLFVPGSGSIGDLV